MCKRFLILVGLLLALTAGAMAEEAIVPGRYAESAEGAARGAGQEVATKTTFAWGGLPLLDAETNAALTSLLKASAFQTRRQGAEGDGYWGMNFLLQNVSVLDFAMMAKDGAYYEQTNLLGGQTVAFTQEEFAAFARRVSGRSAGALPQNLDAVYEIALMTLGGMDHVTVDMQTLDAALQVLDDWQIGALSVTERARPETAIPGIYGANAAVCDVTREEALALAAALGELIAADDTALASAVNAQAGGDADKARELMARVTEMLNALSDTLAAALPENMEPAEYREIIGLDGALAAKQVEVAIPGDLGLFVEWIPAEHGIPQAYVSLSAPDSAITLLFTRDIGSPMQTGKVSRARNRYIAEVALMDGDFQTSLMMTRVENIEQRDGKEILNARTEWMAQSDALLGPDAVVTLSLQETDTASGAGADYKRKHEMNWYLKGLGFDRQKVLTVLEETAVQDAGEGMDVSAGIVRPAALRDEDFDTWLSGVQVSLVQVGYTCLGRLPSDVAAYVLDRYFQ